MKTNMILNLCAAVSTAVAQPLVPHGARTTVMLAASYTSVVCGALPTASNAMEMWNLVCGPIAAQKTTAPIFESTKVYSVENAKKHVGSSAINSTTLTATAEPIVDKIVATAHVATATTTVAMANFTRVHVKIDSNGSVVEHSVSAASANSTLSGVISTAHAANATHITVKVAPIEEYSMNHNDIPSSDTTVWAATSNATIHKVMSAQHAATNTTTAASTQRKELDAAAKSIAEHASYDTREPHHNHRVVPPSAPSATPIFRARRRATKTLRKVELGFNHSATATTTTAATAQCSDVGTPDEIRACERSYKDYEQNRPASRSGAPWISSGRNLMVINGRVKE